MIKKIKSFSLEKIVEKEYLGEIQTYDFTIPTNHCFYANGVLIHNSGVLEEHSDAVLLCFWEHFYNSEKPFNNYDIIIAKQRNGVTGKLRIKFFPQHYRFEEEVFNNPELTKAQETFGGTFVEREND